MDPMLICLLKQKVVRLPCPPTWRPHDPSPADLDRPLPLRRDLQIDTDFPELTQCDCSVCRKKNALMVKVHESAFRLLAGACAGRIPVPAGHTAHRQLLQGVRHLPVPPQA